MPLKYKLKLMSFRVLDKMAPSSTFPSQLDKETLSQI